MRFRGPSKMRSLRMSFDLDDMMHNVNAMEPRNSTQGSGQTTNALQQQQQTEAMLWYHGHVLRNLITFVEMIDNLQGIGMFSQGCKDDQVGDFGLDS